MYQPFANRRGGTFSRDQRTNLIQVPGAFTAKAHAIQEVSVVGSLVRDD
jgi:hypothetical protein